MIELKKDFTPRELRQFALFVWPAFCGMAGWLIWRQTGIGGLPLAFCLLGVAGAVVGVLWPFAVRPVCQGMHLAPFPIGWAMSHLVLGALYYCILTPIGLLLRLAGRDLLTRKLDPAASTYWVPHAMPGDAERYFRQH